MGEIKLDAHNYRKHDERNLKLIKKSLKECGAGRSILIDADGEIIAGNATFKTAQELGIPVEVIKTDGTKVVALQRTDLHTQDRKRKEMALMDNTTSDKPNWDYEEISTDFSADELPELGLEDLPNFTADNAEVVEDEVPSDEEVETMCKPGDIWQLGEHRLMCGDSTVITDVEKLIKGSNDVDLVFTDPPYGISVVSEDGKVGADFGVAKKGNYAKVIADDTTQTAKDAYGILSALCKKLIIWGGNYFVDFLPFSDGWIIWDKRADSGIRNTFADGEMAWCSFHTPVRIYRQLWNGMIREGEHDKRVHPTQKPVKLLADILKDFSKEHDLVLDLFGGSGSTLIACEQLNRKCLMMELDEHYCDVIITRWENLTGKQAQRIE